MSGESERERIVAYLRGQAEVWDQLARAESSVIPAERDHVRYESLRSNSAALLISAEKIERGWHHKSVDALGGGV